MLEVDELKAGYGRQDVLHGLSLPPLAAGELTALLGPEAAASPRCSRRWRASSAGARADDGRDACDGRSGRARHVVYLPQGLPAEVHLRVFESVLVAARAGDGLAPSASPAEIETLLERLGIAPWPCIIWTRSRAAEAAGRPGPGLDPPSRVLLLDEPLSALDLNYQFHVMQLLRQETRRHGLISVIVLHDLNAALQHADRAVLIHQAGWRGRRARGCDHAAGAGRRLWRAGTRGKL